MNIKSLVLLVLVCTLQRLICIHLSVFAAMIGIHGNDTNDFPTTVVFRPETIAEVWQKLMDEEERRELLE